ncbi:MAG: hypothetical protein ACFFC3_06245 [Candidatus Odinarchaeota archaeon]
MLENIYCDKCGHPMKGDVIYKEDNKDCTHYYCSKCGFNYESGFRYNALMKQYIKYIHFHS